MARTARIVIPGEPHHITQRGNNKQNVFLSNRGETDPSGLLDLSWWKSIQDSVEWKQILMEGLPENVPTTLMRNTQTGRPLGSESFIHQVETKLNRRVRPLPGGRPRKDKTR